MRLIFIHGWSVYSKKTYGDLPKVLAARADERGLSIEIVDLWLGRYISFRDEVRMDDVSRAMQQALLDALPDGNGGILPFSCITHSTGGPVVRSWVDRYFGATNLAACPLRHLVMLAPANHGSALAVLGTSRVGRLKAWFEGIQPGAGILRWLELGSAEACALNLDWFNYEPLAPGCEFRPFVLSGETIDRKLYDYVNSYTGEAGSDGVVRLAAANMNYSWLALSESNDEVPMAGEHGREGGPRMASMLRYDDDVRITETCPFYIVPGASHSGEKIGIMRSPNEDNADSKPVVGAIFDALAVKTKKDYLDLATRWDKANQKQQSGKKRRRRFFQIILRVHDDQGSPVTDYDFILLAGPAYEPDRLPKGFFVDKQLNKHSRHTVTFYLDFDAMMAVPQNEFGFRILARPDEGFAWYRPVEFRASAAAIDQFVDPNTTLYIDVTLKRRVDRETARLDPATVDVDDDFRGTVPSGIDVP